MGVGLRLGGKEVKLGSAIDTRAQIRPGNTIGGVFLGFGGNFWTPLQVGGGFFDVFFRFRKNVEKSLHDCILGTTANKVLLI